MTAIERLNELLDERGVEWVESADSTATVWIDGTHVFIAEEDEHGRLHLKTSVGPITPEQAVDETVGNNDRMTSLMNEFLRMLDERDTLDSKFEVSQSMRHSEYEQYTKENAKLRELVADMWPFVKTGSILKEHMAARMHELGIEVDE